LERRILRGQRAISTIYTSLIFLLLVFSILILLLAAFFGYNLAVQEQMRIEDERSQEKIILSALELNHTDPTFLSHILINNTGTIEVRIRAVYVTNGTGTSLICDPSNYMDTHIAPSDSLRIHLLGGVPFEPNATITVATERGIKTKEYEAPFIFGSPKPPGKYDPSRLYIGPLMLQFDAFWYQKTFQNGTLDPEEPWHPGWSISKGFGYCAWNITVMNIDDRNITINRFSSFTAVPNDSPSRQLTWYLEPTNQTGLAQLLPVNQTQSIIYTYSAPKSLPEEGGTNSATKMNLPETRCMVFLTFYGVFYEHDGTTTTYAQTIPFEAAITVV
jgi:hypothetical protein